MNEGDKVLVKSTDGSPDIEGTVTRVWSESFVRVAAVHYDQQVDQTKHDEIDMPYGEAVDGYRHYAVPADAPSVPVPAPNADSEGEV
jgi:hypothetical protein